MRIKFWLLFIIVFLAGLLVFKAATAMCWDCPPRKCWNDLQCGIGCWCYIGQYELNGVCVTE